MIFGTIKKGSYYLCTLLYLVVHIKTIFLHWKKKGSITATNILELKAVIEYFKKNTKVFIYASYQKVLSIIYSNTRTECV